MFTKLITFWERLHGTFWFLPTIMVILAIILAAAMIYLDQRIPLDEQDIFDWLGTTSAEGARSFLSTVAGSMISVAGVTFSITLVALSQTSSQYGPRLIANFLRNRGNQIVLGTFIATFVYCMLVLRTIRGTDEFAFVPHIAVTIGMVLTILSVGVLVYFIHHISTSLRAETIVTNIGHDLEAGIARLFPEQETRNTFEHELRNDDDIPDDLDENAAVVESLQSGYVQTINYERLEHIASEHDLLIRLTCRAGQFMVKEDTLARVWPQDRLTDEISTAILEAFMMGSQRLQLQDVEFAIHQLVEVAVRSLSSGINDPFTAIACIDQLSTTLAEFAERYIPAGYHYDESGRLRVVRNVLTFHGVINTAFDKLRRYGRSHVDVTIRLLESLAIISARVRNHTQADAIIQQAEMIMRGAENAIPEPNDRRLIEARYEQVKTLLHNKGLAG